MPSEELSRGHAVESQGMKITFLGMLLIAAIIALGFLALRQFFGREDSDHGA
jgi:hypothetical protein